MFLERILRLTVIISGGLIGRAVQRMAEAELFGFIREPADLRARAAGGNGYFAELRWPSAPRRVGSGCAAP